MISGGRLPLPLAVPRLSSKALTPAEASDPRPLSLLTWVDYVRKRCTFFPPLWSPAVRPRGESGASRVEDRLIPGLPGLREASVDGARGSGPRHSARASHVRSPSSDPRLLRTDRERPVVRGGTVLFRGVGVSGLLSFRPKDRQGVRGGPHPRNKSVRVAFPGGGTRAAHGARERAKVRVDLHRPLEAQQVVGLPRRVEDRLAKLRPRGFHLVKVPGGRRAVCHRPPLVRGAGTPRSPSESRPRHERTRLCVRACVTGPVDPRRVGAL